MSKKELKRATHYHMAFALYSQYMDGIGDLDKELWLNEINRHLVKAGKTWTDFTREEGQR